MRVVSCPFSMNFFPPMILKGRRKLACDFLFIVLSLTYVVFTAPTKSKAFDEKNLILYATIHQIFSIWIIPFWRAPVTLTTVLQLVEIPPSSSAREKRLTYLIQSQNDLYQVTEFVKFGSLFGVLRVLVLLGQFIATGFCVLGAYLLWPVSWVEQNVIGGNAERSLNEVAQS